MIYANAKRFKLLAKCDNVLEGAILKMFCFLVNFVDF